MGGNPQDFWDGDRNRLESRQVMQPGSLQQGICCDADCVCCVRSYQNGYRPEVPAFDWEGRLLMFANGAGQGQINVYALRFVPVKAG